MSTPRLPIAYEHENTTAFIRKWLWIGVLMAQVFACGGTPPAKEPPPPALDDGQSAEPTQPVNDKLKPGIAAIQAGEFNKAKDLLEQARATSSKDPQVAFYLGVALQGLTDNVGASAAYKEALALDPRLTEASVNLSALQLESKDAASALHTAEQALKSAPSHADLLLNRALALEALGNKAEALGAYKQAAAAAPGNAELHIAYAELLAAAGKREQALAELKRLGNSDQVTVLAALSRQFGQLKAFADCVATLDKALKLKPSADLYVRRGVCRHDLHDDTGALADYVAAQKLDANFAPAYYYAGMHYRQKGDKKKAIESLDHAASLAGNEGVGKLGKQAADALRSKK